ncbi:MAG: hypothetical protein ABEJ67_00685 [Halanaeroarchaeum sp.]
MTDDTDSTGATAPDDERDPDETEAGTAPRTDADEADDADAPDEEVPPGVRDDEDRFEDKYDEAREVANPDQHRDDPEYD